MKLTPSSIGEKRAPAAAITYTVDVTAGMTDLVQDTDVPRLPDDFHDLLVAGAMVREYEKTDDQRLSVSMQRYRERLSALKFWLAQSGSVQPSRQMQPRSRLGPYFAAGT